MLSQAEIDALLNGAIEIENTQGSVNLAELMEPTTAAKEGTEGPKVSAYNFWSPGSLFERSDAGGRAGS